MASRRTYFVDSKEVTITGTSAVPVLYGAGAAAADFNVVKVSVEVEAVSSPSPPNNGSILFQLAVVTGAVGGGASVTPNINGAGTIAAQSTWKSGSTALTGLTQGVSIWSHAIPLTSGAWCDEWFPDGFEKNVTTSGLIAMYYTAASGAGSGLAAKVTLEIAE